MWPSDWIRGVLTAAVLSIVGQGETYGYLLAQKLEQGVIPIVLLITVAAARHRRPLRK